MLSEEPDTPLVSAAVEDGMVVVDPADSTAYTLRDEVADRYRALGSDLSRRQLLRSGAAVGAGAMLAVVLPTVAAASSAPGGGTPPGTLTNQGKAVTTVEALSPQSVAWNPSGSLLAVAAVGSVDVYTVGAGGALTLAASATTGVDTPSSVAFDSTGGFLAVANTLNPLGTSTAADTVAIFSVAGDGTLTFDTAVQGSSPQSVAFSPAGPLLAVADGSVETFKVSGSGGLTSGGSSAEQVSSPKSVAFDATGGLLAVANQANGAVDIFTVGPGGALTLASSISGLASLYSVAFNPAGTLLAVANYAFTPGSSTIEVYAVGSGGALTPAASTADGVQYPYAVAFDPTGTLLAVGNLGLGGSTVEIFTVGSGGALTLAATATTGVSDPYSVAFDPTGRFLAVANFSGNTVQVFGVA